MGVAPLRESTGLSSLSSAECSIWLSQRRVCVLLPVPDSPKNSTALPLWTMAEAWMGEMRLGSEKSEKAIHMAKRRSDKLSSEVASKQSGQEWRMRKTCRLPLCIEKW